MKRKSVPNLVSIELVDSSESLIELRDFVPHNTFLISLQHFRRLQSGVVTYANRTCGRICSSMLADQGLLVEERHCCNTDLCNLDWQEAQYNENDSLP